MTAKERQDVRTMCLIFVFGMGFGMTIAAAMTMWVETLK